MILYTLLWIFSLFSWSVEHKQRLNNLNWLGNQNYYQQTTKKIIISQIIYQPYSAYFPKMGQNIHLHTDGLAEKCLLLAEAPLVALTATNIYKGLQSLKQSLRQTAPIWTNRRASSSNLSAYSCESRLDTAEHIYQWHKQGARPKGIKYWQSQRIKYCGTSIFNP